MSLEERVGKVEKRVKNVEEAIALLSNLLASHDDRLEDSVKDNENLEAKMAALIDAQIRTEDKMVILEAKMVELAEAQARSDAKMAELAESQIRSDARMAALIEVQNKKRK